MVGLSALALYIGRYMTAVQMGVTGDDARYLVLAESFVTGLPYRIVSFPEAPLETIWPPGYPLFILAPAGILFGIHNYDILRATSVLLTLVALAPLYFLIRSRVDSSLIALLAIALFALNPTTAGLAGMVMSEAAFILFALVALWLLERWCKQNQGEGSWWLVLVTGLLIAAAILIRYQGLALAVATVGYLLFLRHWKAAAMLSLAIAVGLVPFLIHLLAREGTSGGSLFAVDMIQGQLLTLVERSPDAISRYASAIPLAMLPFLGPKVADYLGGFGVSFVVNVFHWFIFLLLVASVIMALRKRDLLAFFLVFYFLLIIVVDNQGGPHRNEARYSYVFLPFSYYLLLQLLGAIAQRVGISVSVFSRAAVLVTTVVLAGFLARNVQQMRSDFSVVDLSIGQDWIRDSTADDAIIATHDPVERYLYLQRRTVVLDRTLLEDALDDQGAPPVDYVLVAPPLRDGSQANEEQKLLEVDSAVTLPMLDGNAGRFDLVWADEPANVFLYKVNPPLTDSG